MPDRQNMYIDQKTWNKNAQNKWSIWFNKTCKTYSLKPQFVNINIKGTVKCSQKKSEDSYWK